MKGERNIFREKLPLLLGSSLQMDPKVLSPGPVVEHSDTAAV